MGLCQFRILRLLRARFGELRKSSNSYKIDVRIFKAQLISGSTYMSRLFGPESSSI